jgi:subtilase family serine protease
MIRPSGRLRRRASAGLSAFGIVGGLLVATPAAIAVHAMTPSIGAHPHYQVAGRASAAAPGAITFSCQVTDPAGCYGPAQIRAAYGVDRLPATGAGRKIVIVDAFQSPTIAHDLALFDQVFELPDPTLNIIAPDGLTPFDPNDGNQIGWAGEITLDVEWAHAIAPGATINLVLAKSNSDADILSATRFALVHNLGDVISQSFGEAEQCMDRRLLDQQHVLFGLATLAGVSLFASSGDQGSAQPTCDGTSFFKAASTPASDPFVTGVGGTRLFANGLTGAYQSETVWNEPDFEAAGGGGFSTVYRTPAYQRGLHAASRGVPDVAYSGAIDGGVLTVWSSSGLGEDLAFIFGGTSAGSPQWAGLAALADQLAGHRLGLLNDQLYALARGPAYGALFHDITTGDNTFHGPVTVPGFAARTGWDAASGVGSPRADTLVRRLAGH